MEPRSISFLVQNLPVEWTEATVAEHFSACGCLLPSSLFLLQRNLAILDFDVVVDESFGQGPVTWNGRKIDVQFLERGVPLSLGGRANQAVSFAVPPCFVAPTTTEAPKEITEQPPTAPQKVWGKAPLALTPVSGFEFPELPARQRHAAQQRHFARPASTTAAAAATAAATAATLKKFDATKPPVRLNAYPELWYVRHASCTVLELEAKLFGTLKHNDFWIREQRNRGGFIDFFSRAQRDEAYALLTSGLPPAKGLLDFGVWQRPKAGKLPVAATPGGVVVVVDPWPDFLPLSQLAQTLQPFGRVVDVYLASKRGKDMGLAKLTTKGAAEVVEVGPYPHFLGLGHATAGRDDVERAEFVKLPAQQFDSVVAMCRFANPHHAELACAQSLQQTLGGLAEASALVSGYDGSAAQYALACKQTEALSAQVAKLVENTHKQVLGRNDVWVPMYGPNHVARVEVAQQELARLVLELESLARPADEEEDEVVEAVKEEVVFAQPRIVQQSLAAQKLAVDQQARDNLALAQQAKSRIKKDAVDVEMARAAPESRSFEELAGLLPADARLALGAILEEICRRPESAQFRTLKTSNAAVAVLLESSEWMRPALRRLGFGPKFVPLRDNREDDEETLAYFLPEPNLDTDFDAWSVWFDSLRAGLALLKTVG